MKLSHGSWFRFLLSCSTLLSTGVAAQESKSITDLIPLIPTCALSCIIREFTPAVLSDPSASCQNATLQLTISTCVQASCTFNDQAKLGVVNAQLCAGVPEDLSRARSLTLVAAVVGPLGIIAILMRTYSRWAITKQMGSDDWTMLAAGVFLVGVLACNFLNVHGYGFGKHYWNLSMDDVTPLLEIFYAAEIFYVMVISLVKVSILLFYLRVFPTKWFRVVNWICIGLVIAAGLGVLLPIFFQCSPIRGAWDKSITSKCVDINLLAYATGGIAVGFDIIILGLPVPQLLKLKMNMRKKLNVLFMFSLGSIACVTSMVRLKYLAEFAKTTDASYDNTIPVLWSIVEICIAIMCACLPALRALFSHYLPKLFPNMSTRAGNSQYQQQEPSLNSVAKGSGGITTISSISSKSKKVMSPTSTIMEKGTKSPLSRDDSWGSVNNAITRDQEFVQDVERDAQPLPSVFDDGINRNTTVTTKIWVSHTPTHSQSPERNSKSRHTHHPLKSHSIDNNINKSGLTTPFHRNNSTSADSITVPLSPGGMSYTNDPDLSREFSRNGSEDSIFALEGPRESDDDEQSMMERGRQQRQKQLEEFEMRELAAMDSARSATFGRRDGSRSQSRARSQSTSGRVPVSVFNRNPPL